MCLYPRAHAQFKVGDGVLWKDLDFGGCDIYYPGTITYINLDGTFAVKYEWADDYGNEKTKHESHVFATKLRVREWLGTGFRCVCVCGCSRLWS